MLYSTKKDLKNRVKPEVNSLGRIAYATLQKKTNRLEDIKDFNDEEFDPGSG